MEILIDTNNLADYSLFLRAKRLPKFRCRGNSLYVPDEYAEQLGLTPPEAAASKRSYKPTPKLWDYQRDITKMAIAKRKFCVFADCGLGKTQILLEWARYVAAILPRPQKVLIVSPLMVVRQTLGEVERWYGDRFPVEHIRAAGLAQWLTTAKTESRVGITNYEALSETTPTGHLGAMVLDESSMLKSHYGKWGQTLIRLGRGLAWKLCLTGTPAPNDRIEYANHAVFMDAYPTVNSFLARFFVNKGQTQERWILKPHALEPFYRELSHWCIFLTNPATYGWKDNCAAIPPIHINMHDVELTEQQREAVYAVTGRLFMDDPGGITKRSKLAQIGKGIYKGQRITTNKPEMIRSLLAGWPDEATLMWCWFNQEQADLAAMFPDAASIDGATPLLFRENLVNDFKAGRRTILISKPRILGFGLNLQVATRQIFSSLIDSYEAFYQAVKRSNRYGSTKALNVHIPVSEIERPMVDNVLRKAARVQADTEEQEAIFKKVKVA